MFFFLNICYRLVPLMISIEYFYFHFRSIDYVLCFFVCLFALRVRIGTHSTRWIMIILMIFVWWFVFDQRFLCLACQWSFVIISSQSCFGRFQGRKRLLLWHRHDGQRCSSHVCNEMTSRGDFYIYYHQHTRFFSFNVHSSFDWLGLFLTCMTEE